MLFTTLSALLESAVNRWLQLDEQAIPRLQALQGRVIAVKATTPGVNLYFIPASDGLRIMDHYDAPPDVTLTGSALAFMRLSGAEDAAKAMLENGIQVAGNMGIAEQFSSILRTVDVDWEELLSHVVGDIIAHQTGQLARSTKDWLTDSTRAMRLNTSEYLQEESRLLPATAELQLYLDAVDTLRMDTDRLAARINMLEKPPAPLKPEPDNPS